MRAYLILAMGFLATALCGAPLPLQAADTVSMTPRVIPVGQWPEGLVFQGEKLLVAESGQRTVAEINPRSGAVVNRWTVGRLPVGMALGADGAVNALIQTDKLVWRLAADGRVSSFGQLAGCPDGLATGGPYVWVSAEPGLAAIRRRPPRPRPRPRHRRGARHGGPRRRRCDRRRAVPRHRGAAFHPERRSAGQWPRTRVRRSRPSPRGSR